LAIATPTLFVAADGARSAALPSVFVAAVTAGDGD
jgi:hypothetical protein